MLARTFILLLGLYSHHAFAVRNHEFKKPIYSSIIERNKSASIFDIREQKHLRQMGTETGNGGDEVRDKFIDIIFNTFIYFEETIIFKGIGDKYLFFESMLNFVSTEYIFTTNDLDLYDRGGSKVNALFLDFSKKNDKYFFVQVFKRAPSKDRALLLDYHHFEKALTDTPSNFTLRLMIHEIFRLNQLNDNDYHLTDMVLRQTDAAELGDDIISNFYTSHIEGWLTNNRFNSTVLKDLITDQSFNDIMTRLDSTLELIFQSQTIYYQRKGNKLIQKILEKEEFSKDPLKHIRNVYFKTKDSLDLLNQYISQQRGENISEDKINIVKVAGIELDAKTAFITVASSKNHLTERYSLIKKLLYPIIFDIYEAFLFNDILAKNHDENVLFCEDTNYSPNQKVRLFIILEKDGELRFLIRQDTQDPVLMLYGAFFPKQNNFKLSEQILFKDEDNNQDIKLIFNKKFNWDSKEKFDLTISSNHLLGYKNIHNPFFLCQVIYNKDLIMIKKFQLLPYL